MLIIELLLHIHTPGVFQLPEELAQHSKIHRAASFQLALLKGIFMRNLMASMQPCRTLPVSAPDTGILWMPTPAAFGTTISLPASSDSYGKGLRFIKLPRLKHGLQRWQ